jgi:hypothetical protein
MPFRNLRSKALAAGYRSGLEEDIGVQLKSCGIEAEYEPLKPKVVSRWKTERNISGFEMNTARLLISDSSLTTPVGNFAKVQKPPMPIGANSMVLNTAALKSHRLGFVKNQKNARCHFSKK